MDERKEIIAALCAAMGEVKKVAREGRNEHDKYNFAGIDDFLKLVNPICSANGLIVHMDEGNREDFTRKGKYGESSWMRQSFDLTLMHVSGQTLPPVTRTVEVLRNGAQAYGSAQSYALKQFWRCILLIPTGDKDDADFAQTDAGTVHHEQPGAPEPTDDAVAKACEYINGADSLADLQRVWGNLPRNLQPICEDIKDKRKAELTPDVNADLDGDQIPYEGK